MHEMSLAESIRQIVETSGRTQGFKVVRRVVLEIGRLSSVEPEALRFCFDAVSRDSIMHGADLAIEEVPGQAWCMSCAASISIPELGAACPLCGGYQIQVTGGTEMRVKELEVD